MMIDVHGHVSPPESLRRYPMPRSLGDVERMIEAKLARGITMTIVGSPVGGGAMVPGSGVDNYAQSPEDLRRFHAWLAGLVHSHPDHLRAYVYVNPFGDDEHLSLAAELATDRAFVGFIANTSVAGRHLDDPAADGFFALAAELGFPVLLHAPAEPAAGQGLTDPLLVEQLGRFCDVTVGLACCVLGGWLDRYPALRLVGTTAGGALGILAEKLDMAWDSPYWGRPPAARAGAGRTTAARLPNPPSTYLSRIWVDTATPSPAALALAAGRFGPDRMLLGTDSPPLPPDRSQRTVELLDALGLDDKQRQGIRRDNAIALFGARLAASMTRPVPGAGERSLA